MTLWSDLALPMFALPKFSPVALCAFAGDGRSTDRHLGHLLCSAVKLWSWFTCVSPACEQSSAFLRRSSAFSPSLLFLSSLLCEMALSLQAIHDPQQLCFLLCSDIFYFHQPNCSPTCTTTPTGYTSQLPVYDLHLAPPYQRQASPSRTLSSLCLVSRPPVPYPSTVVRRLLPICSRFGLPVASAPPRPPVSSLDFSPFLSPDFTLQ
ncbi:hypothetical protein CF319_g7634 [Tilletia indica]|nr:hypothetical protein CF319_g7634 [Tilletia indica]